MRSSLVVSSFLLLATVLVCAAGDDLDALKATFLKLCTANTEGKFGACCLANNNWQDITAINGTSVCLDVIVTASTSGAIQKLFVVNVICFLGMMWGSHRTIRRGELTTIPAGAFSELPSLVFLQSSAALVSSLRISFK